VQGFTFAVGAGLGFTMVMILMASIRVQTELARVPALMKGPALVFLLAATLSMAFMGFAGLFS
jgi:electron transport complex protein RnfA